MNWRRRHASMENAGTLLPQRELNIAPHGATQCAKCGIVLQEEELAFNRRLVEIAERKAVQEEGEDRSGGGRGGAAGSPSPSKRARENPEEEDPAALYWSVLGLSSASLQRDDTRLGVARELQ